MGYTKTEIKEIVKKGAQGVYDLHKTLLNIQKTLKSDTASYEEKEEVSKDYNHDYDSVKKITEPVEKAIGEFGHENHARLRESDKEYDKNYYNFLDYKEELEVYDIPLTRGAVYYYNKNKDAGVER